MVDGDTGDCFLIKSGVRQGCILPPDCLDVATDYVLDRSTHRAVHGASLRLEASTDFDYADDVGLPSELLCLLVSVFEMFAKKATLVRLTEINWKKARIQSLSDVRTPVPDLWRAG